MEIKNKRFHILNVLPFLLLLPCLLIAGLENVELSNIIAFSVGACAAFLFSDLLAFSFGEAIVPLILTFLLAVELGYSVPYLIGFVIFVCLILVTGVFYDIYLQRKSS